MRLRSKNLIIPFLSMLCALLLGGQVAIASAITVTTDRTESTLLADVKSIQAGKPFYVAVQVKLQPGWHTYWINPGDSGTPPQFAWTLPSGFNASNVEYLAPDREKVGPLVDFAYDKEAYFLFAIQPASIIGETTTSILMLKAKWLVCKDVCIPETADLSLALPTNTKPQAEPSDDAKLVESLIARIPTKLDQPLTYSSENDMVHFALEVPQPQPFDIKSALFFPADDGFISNDDEQTPTITAGEVTFNLKTGGPKPPAKTWGLVSLLGDNGARKDYRINLEAGASTPSPSTATPPKNTGPSAGLLGAAFFAFLGGLILNLMPCVFPILSLKALAVAKKADVHPREVRMQGIAYTVGAIASFLLLAFVLIAAQKASGHAFGWGYQMQSPTFVAFLALLFFAVGINLSGGFELPSFFGSFGSDAANKDNLFGSFLTGALAVLVATPCTAPFMAPAVGFALSQDTLTVISVFAALGLGLAAPFLLISLIPSLTHILPRPGAWMLTFKQFLSFPMFLTVIWLVWVLTREGGPDAGAALLFSFVMIMFAIWLRLQGTFFKVFGILIMLAAFAISAIVIQESAPADVIAVEKAEHFSVAKLEALRADHKAVFVDATADWCITCKVNERVALSDDAVKKAFAGNHITYLIADWTKGDPEITQYLASFGRRGVPIYVYYAPNAEPVVLPQLLTPSTVLEAIK